MSSPGILVGRQKLADFHLDQFDQLLVVHLVDLVQVDHHERNADLAAEQDVLARLRHRAVGRVHHQDRAVHLRRTRDHVLHVVGVARAVDMGIVTRRRLVFHMRRRDRDPPRLLLRRRVDLVVRLEIAEILRDRRRQRRLAVVNVTNRANVHMRFSSVQTLPLPSRGRLMLVGGGEGPVSISRATYWLGGEKSSVSWPVGHSRGSARRPTTGG